MARVVTECRPEEIPFGVDYLWDPECALATAVATEAAFMREVAIRRLGVGYGSLGTRRGSPFASQAAPRR